MSTHKKQMFCWSFLLVVFLVTLFSSYLTPYDANTMNMSEVYESPNGSHLFGTDHLGRDVLTRLIQGGKVTLTVATVATILSFIIGLIYGGISGYLGGVLDTVMMRIVEVLLTIPSILIILVCQAFMQGNIWSMILIIGLTSWYTTARMIRTEFLKLNQMEFVQMAKMIGTPSWKIILDHLLRNSIQAVFVVTLFNFAGAIFVEVSLSFLGIGVPPAVPSWGNMLYHAQSDFIAGAWWIGLFPGLLIIFTVLAINMIGSSSIKAKGGQ
ncbi:ABC transporter permease [Sporosarcina obsidiansis]|uniref:ABC transporter permease n=1 Tax=Sporosarcina obsidiansis TaxID=2660748 RepID=UPI001E4EFE11|nr:ABC transporter permease [Sporosarcina obsidiansis]